MNLGNLDFDIVSDFDIRISYFSLPDKALFWSFFVNFCAFFASLRLKRTVFSRLLKKAISMALWTKANLCVKSSLLEQSLPRTPSQLKQNQCNLRNLRLKNSCLYSLYLCAFLWLKNLFNQRNQRLIEYLRACKALYICRETFTDVMSALQIKLFMQNEPKFRKSQMNVNKVLTKDYENKTLGEHGKNEPKTNPNEPKTNPIKANKMPKQTQYKPNQTQPVVSLPALPALSAVEGSAVEGVEPISEPIYAVAFYAMYPVSCGFCMS